MMIAACSALDADPNSYSSIFQPTDICLNNTGLSPNPESNDYFYNMNTYPYLSNGDHMSPKYLQNSEDDLERNRARLSSSEDERRARSRNFFNDNLMSSSLSIHAAASRFQLDRFPSDIIQRSPTIHIGLPSPPENSRGFTDYSASPLKAKQCPKRSVSDDHAIPVGSKLQQPPSAFEEDDDDNMWKVCGVCNDKATGYHFNAMTCEGCKGFFRRSMKSGKEFTCSYNNDCNITKTNRRQCQACRLRKCIEIGMKRECIMSEDQIQQKKTLVLTNRIKRAALLWMPLELSPEQMYLLTTISSAFKESNVPPDTSEIRGAEAIEKENSQPTCPSPGSSHSSNNNYAELMTFMTDQMKAPSRSSAPNDTTPSKDTDPAHVIHFTDIMEYSIKQVIKFCKKVPTFMKLEVRDQIALLKAGCTEVMFLKANYTYDSKKKALSLGQIIYTRESFLQGGMSGEYADAYLKFHDDLKLMQLDDTEMASLSAIAVFSADRSDITSPGLVELQQEEIAFALNAYTDSSYKKRNRFANIMSFLPRLRKLNSLCTEAFSKVQKKYEKDIKPLVIETQPDTDTES